MLGPLLSNVCLFWGTRWGGWNGRFALKPPRGRRGDPVLILPDVLGLIRHPQLRGAAGGIVDGLGGAFRCRSPSSSITDAARSAGSAPCRGRYREGDPRNNRSPQNCNWRGGDG